MKALARLCICTGLSEPLLLADAIPKSCALAEIFVCLFNFELRGKIN